jgi:integrase
MAVKIRERKPGEWWVYIDHKNKRKSKKIGTKDAAQKVAKQIEARLTLGDLGILKPEQAEKPEPTFAEYQKTWLEQAPVHCKQSTIDFYQDYQDRYILPRFGTLRLTEITKPRVLSMIAELKDRGLAKNTVRLAVASLRTVLSMAVEDELIPKNPALASSLGKRAINGKAKRESRSMEPEEAEAFLRAAEETPYHALFFIALRAGLREGEILALRWQDIDFRKNLIHVARRWYHNQYDLPKGNRTRYVDMSQQLKAVLHFAQTVRSDSDLLFPSPGGQPIGASSFTKNWFKPTLKTAGLCGFTIHDLRHTFGSLLLDQGAPLAYVSEQMGHASTVITAQIYVHSLRKNAGFVNRLDTQPAATQPQPRPDAIVIPAEISGEVIDSNGGPTRIRTWNQQIMSLLL